VRFLQKQRILALDGDYKLTAMKIRVKTGHLVTKTSPIAVYFCKCSSILILERECPMPKPWVFYYCELILPAKIGAYSVFILL